jgi:hypothetical protein
MKALFLALIAAALGLAAGFGWSALRLGSAASGDPFDAPTSPTLQAAATSGSSQEKPPRLVVRRKGDAMAGDATNRYTHDFGEMPRHSPGQVEYIFRNEGEGPLVLSKGHSSCQCTVGELSDTNVQPGAETTVTLSWKTETAESSFRHHAEIGTNDPQRTTIHLEVTGKITLGLEVEPKEVALGGFNVRDGKQAQFTVLAFHSSGLKITSCELAPASDEGEAIDASLAKSVEFSHEPLSPQELPSLTRSPKSGHRVTVLLKPGLPQGRIERKIRVATNLAAPLEVSLAGTALGDVSVAAGGGWIPTREVLYLDDIDTETSASKRIHLLVTGQGFGQVQVKLKEKETDPPELKAVVGQPQPGTESVRWPITVTLPRGTRPMSRIEKGNYGKIVLETTNPHFKEFVIPVRLLVREARP